MSINKDLNVDPYYDDYDESKQFNRILFTPAKAVQARELTQLQTILQKQVERFGSNIYKEGTIISGINLTARDDLFYVKLKDQVGFTNPSLYDELFSEEGSSTRFILRGSSGLKAEIVKGLNGFETSAPDLKTFYIIYLNTSRDNADVNDKKQFGENETLSLLDADETPVTVNGSPLTFSTFAPGNGSHVGRAFAVSCEPGVLYQKGHFIFVDRQFSVVTRYSNIPGQGLNPDDRSEVIPISVGFTVEENIINSNQDLSLADNALGYNNYNAPGADRLQLLPKLVSFATADEPSEFFALIRYKDGKSVRLRDYTQYSLLGEELARRTYEESGNYVLNGLEATLESPIFDNNNTEDESDDDFFAQVSLSPGKAYVYGKEVRNVSTAKHRIDKVTSTQTKENHIVLADYDQHYLSDSANASATIDFNFDGGFNYKLLNGTTPIGTCCISNVEPGKIYVYNVSKTDPTVNPTHIGLPSYDNGIEANRVALTLDSNNLGLGLQNTTKGCMLFDTGKNSIASISSTNLVLRKRLSSVPINSDSQYVIPKTDSEIPIESKDVFGIKDNVMYVPETVNQDFDGTSRGIGSPSITITFDEDDNLNDTSLDWLYYNTVAVDFSPDTLEEKTRFIRTDYSLVARTATLGHPNVIEVEQVMYEQGDQRIDVTSSFMLVNNQNDSFYDISYIQLKSGAEVPPETTLIVKIKLLERNSGNTNPGGYLTADSYTNITSKHLVGKYTAKNLKTFEIRNCYDFRAYAVKLGTSSGTGLASSPISFIDRPGDTPISYPIQFANKGVINSTIQYYLNRIDSLTMDEYGNTEIVKGAEEDTPVKPELNRRYEIASIYNPGNTIRTTGDRCITLTEKSNKVYRMNDIQRIENKVDGLTDMVALSLSELSANNLLVTGADGVERFKNGILTDTFSSYIGANFTDPQFNCGIDKSRTIAMPSMNQFPIDLKVDSPLNVSDQISADAFENVTTLQQSGIVAFIDQPYATNFRNCVSNYYNYQGTAQLHPAFVSGHDIVKNPEITLDLDLASPILDLVDNLQEFIPLTREGESSTERTSQFIDRVNRWHDGAPVRVRNFVESTPIESLTSSTASTTESVGNFITDISMKPYLKSEKIKVLVTGLRPNTVHHFFFDEKSVDQFVSPAFSDTLNNLSASKVRGGSKVNIGNNIKSDANGNIFAVFHMPAATFFVGENLLEVVDVDQYSSIESGSTSYGKVAFRGYNFSISKSELNASTRTVDFDTEVTSITERAFQVRTRDPIAQTFRVKSAAAKDANYVYLSDIDVYFKRASLTTGVTLQIRETTNGYPSKTVLPFSQKIINANEVSVSDDGTTPTKFKFDNPVKLKSDNEYCFVVIPAGNSPEYLIHTCKVGETSKSQGNSPRTVSVTNDWGDGALFTSTNDSAWKSYQDEDIKFQVNRYDFKTEGSLDLVPNDVEILQIRNNQTVSDADANVIPFEIGEIAYAFSEDRFEQDMTIGGSNTNAPNQLRVSRRLIDVEPGGPNYEQEAARREFNIGDYVHLNNNAISTTKKLVTKIIDVSTEVVANDQGVVTDTLYVFTLQDPYDIYTISGNTSTTVKVVRVTAGIVSHYNPNRRDKLHLKASSARENNYFDNFSPVFINSALLEGQIYTVTHFGDGVNNATRKNNWITAGVPPSAPLGNGESDNAEIIGYQFIASGEDVNSDMNGKVRPNTQAIYGLDSGASAIITLAGVEKLSYFQANVPVDNSQNTSYTLELKKNIGGSIVSDRVISNNANVYMPKTVRSIKSKSKQIEESPSSPREDFRISTTLKSNVSTVTPILDSELASLNAYQYFISDQENSTSNYISKEVILNPELPARGIRVLLSGFRPIGTYIDVYARFTYADDPDSPRLATIDGHFEGGDAGNYTLASDWKKLENSNEDVFSSASNQKDYRDFEYNLDETRTTGDYSTFQIRIVLRHATATELDNPQMSQVTPDVNIFPTLYDYKAIAVT